MITSYMETAENVPRRLRILEITTAGLTQTSSPSSHPSSEQEELYDPTRRLPEPGRRFGWPPCLPLPVRRRRFVSHTPVPLWHHAASERCCRCRLRANQVVILQ